MHKFIEKIQDVQKLIHKLLESDLKSMDLKKEKKDLEEILRTLSSIERRATAKLTKNA